MMLVSVTAEHGAKRHALGSEADGEAPWQVHIRAVDNALAKKDLSLATRAWQNAYDAALERQRCDALVEVGDASLRIGEVGGLPKPSEARARWIYLAALVLARKHRLLDGVLRAAEAFATLGDREVVNQCICFAEGLAGHASDGKEHDRLHPAKARLAALLVVAESKGTNA